MQSGKRVDPKISESGSAMRLCLQSDDKKDPLGNKGRPGPRGLKHDKQFNASTYDLLKDSTIRDKAMPDP